MAKWTAILLFERFLEARFDASAGYVIVAISMVNSVVPRFQTGPDVALNQDFSIFLHYATGIHGPQSSRLARPHPSGNRPQLERHGRRDRTAPGPAASGCISKDKRGLRESRTTVHHICLRPRQRCASSWAPVPQTAVCTWDVRWGASASAECVLRHPLRRRGLRSGRCGASDDACGRALVRVVDVGQIADDSDLRSSSHRDFA